MQLAAVPVPTTVVGFEVSTSCASLGNGSVLQEPSGLPEGGNAPESPRTWSPTTNRIHRLRWTIRRSPPELEAELELGAEPELEPGPASELVSPEEPLVELSARSREDQAERSNTENGETHDDLPQAG